jgi:simple sugar transport system permease protein
LAAGAIALLIVSEDPSGSLTAVFLGPFKNIYNFGNMLSTAAPLMLTGLGIVIAFRTSLFNLGGEGQVYSGALIATVVCLTFPNALSFPGILLSLAAATALGSLIAGISGLFYVKWRTNELLSSFLISSVLILLVDYLITGPFDDPCNNLPSTETIPSRFWLTRLLPPSHLNAAVIVAILGCVLVYVLLFRTRLGYEMRICGENREFARYGGIRAGIVLTISMIVSGGFHGMAGAVVVLGTHHACIQGFSFGLGWNGIAVALIGRNHPAGVVLAALLYAYLDAGAKAAVIHSNVSLEIAALVQAIIFYLITAQGLISWIPREGLIKQRGRPPLKGRRSS